MTAVTTAGKSFLVQPAAMPPNASAWNVYAGLDPQSLWRQNSAAIETGQTWLQPNTLTTSGIGQGCGQAPNYLHGDTADYSEGLMATTIGSAVTSRVIELLTGTSGVNLFLSGCVQDNGQPLAALSATQVRAQNVAADIGDKANTMQYPAVNVYCDKIVNSLTEKFRSVLGNRADRGGTAGTRRIVWRACRTLLRITPTRLRKC